MDNENLINSEQPAPVVEKVSLKEIEEEKNQLSPEEKKVVDRLINATLALKGESLDKAIAFVNKKLEILKNLNKEE